MSAFGLFFPVLVLLFAGTAWFFPVFFQPMKPAIIWLLGVIMFGMGMTLTKDDFVRVIKRPGLIGMGALLQFGIMPFTAFIVSLMFGLPEGLLIGMILVGTAPGGTASNVICYLARADVALSISMTLVSTLLAVILMPLLTWLYLHKSVSVDAIAMLKDILLITILPVALGVIINTVMGKSLGKVRDLFPFISVLAISMIVAIIVSLSKDRLVVIGLLLASAVILHNLVGLVLGYSVTRMLGHDARTSRTIAIEVGMQNSGLAVAMAGLHFAKFKLAVLPGALFSIWHNLSGAVLASFWSLKNNSENNNDTEAGKNPGE